MEPAVMYASHCLWSYISMFYLRAAALWLLCRDIFNTVFIFRGRINNNIDFYWWTGSGDPRLTDGRCPGPFLVIDWDPDLINIWVERHLVPPPPLPVVFRDHWLPHGAAGNHVGIPSVAWTKGRANIRLRGLVMSALALKVSPKYLCSNKSALASDRRREDDDEEHQCLFISLHVLTLVQTGRGAGWPAALGSEELLEQHLDTSETQDSWSDMIQTADQTELRHTFHM